MESWDGPQTLCVSASLRENLVRAEARRRREGVAPDLCGFSKLAPKPIPMAAFLRKCSSQFKVTEERGGCYMRLYTIILLGTAFLTACAPKYTFPSQPLNSTPLPNDFKNRVVIKNSIDFRINPVKNIGLFIAANGNGYYSVISQPTVASGYTPIAENMDGAVYESTIDRGASAQGSYLALAAASLSDKQVAQLTIKDQVHAYVPLSGIPEDRIFSIAGTPSTEYRYWIADLYISSISTSVFTNLEGNTAITAPAFGAKGAVYQKGGVAAQDWSVAARLINVDAYAKARNMPYSGPIPPMDTSGAIRAALGQNNEFLPSDSPGIYSVLPSLEQAKDSNDSASAPARGDCPPSHQQCQTPIPACKPGEEPTMVPINQQTAQVGTGGVRPSCLKK